MTYRRILLTAMLAGLLPAAAALAQTSTTPPPADSTAPMATTATPMAPVTTTVTGKVVSSTTIETVVETDGGQRLSLTTDTATSMPALSTGDRVSARYSTLLNGSYHAESIALSSVAPTDNVIVTPPVAVTTTTATTAIAPAKTSLPKTASSLPLVTLIGALAGLGVAALHRKDA